MNTIVRRRPSLVEEVCVELANEIRKEAYGEDGWLPAERVMASKLGVSRNVFREAAKRLESQGLIEVQHGRGIKVVHHLHKPLNGSLAYLIPEPVERLRQLMEARFIIEPEMARLAAQRVKAGDLRDFRKAQAGLAQAETVEEAARYDLEFHQALARAAGNKALGLVLDSLAELGKESRRHTISYAGINRAVGHHQRILDAVEKHQPDEAHAAMRFHLEGAASDLEKHLKTPIKPTEK